MLISCHLLKQWKEHCRKCYHESTFNTEGKNKRQNTITFYFIDGLCILVEDDRPFHGI